MKIARKDERLHLSDEGARLRKRMIAHAEDVLATPESLAPFIHAETSRGDGVIVSLAGMDGDRTQIAERVRTVFKTRDVVRYGFISESWMAMIDGADDPRIEVRPRDRENKTEVVSVLVVERDAEPVLSMLDIERGEDGRGSLVDGQIGRMLAGGAIESPWATLLDPS